MGPMQVRPGDIERLREPIRQQVASACALPGCDHYAFSTDLIDSDRLWITERWTDKQAQSAHMISDHMVQFNIDMRKAKIQSSNINAFSQDGSVTRLISVGQQPTIRGTREMIIVMGTIRMGDGEIDRLNPELAAQMAATQAEDGCEQYVFSKDVTDPNLLLISERWRDADALRSHGKAPHMAVFNKVIGGAKVLGISVKAYDVTGVRQLLGSD
jgi:quinol monooxygenase YgiN